MKFEIKSARAAALVALIASAEAAKHGHGHSRHHETREVVLEKKGGQCQFPTDAGLVAVTPNEENAGWAMSPNQPCKPGNYCPYACPPGEVSMQWDPKATSYSYPMSMNGGLYCDESGNIQKPFPNRDYCESAAGVLKAHNKAGKPVSFCQTVLPGNEAMIIPTLVEELADLAVPGMSYWCSTAAQYYINAPGVSTEEGCVWGTSANPVGNWSPYTAGANTDAEGNTYLKIGWNPIYLEPTTPFRDVKPEFGIEIECEGDGCNGLPCKIDPAVNSVNEMIGNPFVGAGGATGCVVTVPKGETAHIVVFEKEGSGSTSSETVSVPTSSATSSSSSSSSTSISTSSPTPTPTSTSTETPTSTPTPSSTSTPTPSSTSTSTATATSSSTSTITSTSTKTPMSSANPSSSTRLPKSSPSLSYTYQPHVLTGSADISEASSTTAAAAASSSSSTGGATSATVSMMTLALGAVAAIAMNL
ncbi:uncharacterized protein N7529_005230 [Penicillium soppii]|jgi:hypothetical protein|uniref:uncharacterized protein n=1 Tax=Penicillium soppii TaxID=69789 RepID=UPI00254692FD|nr:uncharacterized protein N7529_005230 [Penicillium soppii]KAJ5872877.1 hypothetical protein N7529_005230 [Penicillium soppii]